MVACVICYFFTHRSSQYIDYEKLKALLTKAKKSADVREDVLKRVPSELVTGIMEERIHWSAGTIETSKTTSAATPVHRKLATIDSEKELIDEEEDEYTPDDSTPLLKTNTKSPLLQYLGLANKREVLLNAYTDADTNLAIFEQMYEHELTKVNNFYHEKTNEISQRIDGLIESVPEKTKKKKKPPHRRTHSLEKWISKKFGPMIHGDHLRSVVKVATNKHPRDLPDIEGVFQESFNEDDDDVVHQDEEEKEEDNKRNAQKELDRVKKLDSIQRAITDIYRTSKLLHNYCILNYTGFSDIARLYDRKFIQYKGKLKDKVCEDGQQTEKMAAKLEQMYSQWFCEGDILEVKAQMLPKRGDGLLMDWSQMRLGYRLGMCSVLALWVAWDCVWVSGGEEASIPFIFQKCVYSHVVLSMNTIYLGCHTQGTSFYCWTCSISSLSWVFWALCMALVLGDVSLHLDKI